jgi:hypothetical protein
MVNTTHRGCPAKPIKMASGRKLESDDDDDDDDDDSDRGMVAMEIILPAR